MKVDVATAAVAKIANKTLKLLCMVSIRGYAKNYLFNRHSCPGNGRRLCPSTWAGSSRVQREAMRFHLASMRALMRLTRVSCAAQYARLAAAVP